jgi:hypothetical protein
MATGAGVRLGTGDAVIVTRENQRTARVRERRSVSLRQRPARALFNSEARFEKLSTITDQVDQGNIEFLTVLQVLRDCNFAPDFDLLLGF